MSVNQSATLPESTLKRIKHTIWKILDLPIKGIEDAKVKIKNEAEHLEIVIKADISKIKLDIDKLTHHDHFKSDAINSNEHTRDFHFTIPDHLKEEINQLAKLTSNDSYSEDAPVVGKNHLVNQVLDNIDAKISSNETTGSAQNVGKNLKEGNQSNNNCGCNCHA